MTLDYKKKSDYWDQKHKDQVAPRRRTERKKVEVSTSVSKKVLTSDDGEPITLRARSKYPELTRKPVHERIQIKKRGSRPQVARRRKEFEVVPDAPPVEHHSDPIRAQERRKVSQKRVERQRRVQRTNIRTVIIIIVVGIIMAFALGSLVMFLRSPYFTITNYTVKGTSYLTSTNVLSHVETDENTSLLPLNTKAVEEALLVNPWIAEVSIKKRLPSSLEITITERAPIAIVSMVNGESWVIASDGIWLGKVSATENEMRAIDPSGEQTAVSINKEKLVTIEDISPVENFYGSLAQSDEVTNAIEVLNGLDAQLRDQVQTISAPEISLTKITTNEHVEILIGSSKDIKEKSRIALELLNEKKGKVTLIDVRSVAKPVYRGLDTE